MPHFSEEETISIIKRLIQLNDILSDRTSEDNVDSASTNNRYATAMQVLAEYNSVDDEQKSFYQWLLERA